MKMSNLIEELQRDLAVFGDLEVAFQCDEAREAAHSIGPDAPDLVPIGAIGAYGGPTGKHFCMLVCTARPTA